MDTGQNQLCFTDSSASPEKTSSTQRSTPTSRFSQATGISREEEVASCAFPCRGVYKVKQSPRLAVSSQPEQSNMDATSEFSSLVFSVLQKRPSMQQIDNSLTDAHTLHQLLHSFPVFCITHFPVRFYYLFLTVLLRHI